MLSECGQQSELVTQLQSICKGLPDVTIPAVIKVGARTPPRQCVIKGPSFIQELQTASSYGSVHRI